MKKSQASLEFLVIFGIGFSIIIILSGLFVMYSSESKDKLDKTQIENIGKNLISNIEQIYFLGSGNKITYRTKFPDGIENLTIYHKNNSNSTHDIYFDYLNITYPFGGKIQDSIFTSSEIYIRFNFSNKNVINIPLGNGNSITYYNDSSAYSEGYKELQIKSKGSFVELEFYRGE